MPKAQKTAVSNRKKDEVKILEESGQNRIKRTVVTDIQKIKKLADEDMK